MADIYCSVEAPGDDARFTLNSCPDIRDNGFTAFSEIIHAFGGKPFRGRIYSRSVAMLPHVLQSLANSGYAVKDLDGSLGRWVEVRAQRMLRMVERAKLNMSSFRATLQQQGKDLMPHQIRDVQSMLSLQRGLNLQPPGLGKTLECLMAVPDSAPILVVGPPVALKVWYAHCEEFRKFSALPTVLNARKKAAYPGPGETLLMSYGMLGGFSNRIHPDTWVFFDEVQAGRCDSKRSRYMRTLVLEAMQAGARIWGLTGTPLMNREQDLWNITRLMSLEYCWKTANPTLWGGFVEVMGGKERKFRVPAQKIKYGARAGQTMPAREIIEWDFYPRRRCTSFSSRLQQIAFRTSKDQALAGMPPLRRQAISCTLKELMARRPQASQQTKSAEELLDRTWASVQHLSDEDLLQELSRNPEFGEYAVFQRVLAELKIPLLLELLDDYQDKEIPVVVFSRHSAPLEALSGREHWGFVHGGVSSKQRDQYVADFQKGILHNMGVNIASGATAITLTRAQVVIFVDRADLAPLNRQAEDRVNRMGQKGSVLVLDIVLDHPLERRKLKVLQKKLETFDSILREVETHA